MRTNRSRLSWRFVSVSAGLLAFALIVDGMQNPVYPAGKGSNGVVKASAVASKVDASGKQTVKVTLEVDKGWHIYANPVKNEDFESVQTVVTIDAKTKLKDIKIQYPKGKEHELKGGVNYFVYENKIVIEAEVTRSANDTSALEVEVRFNACSDAQMVCLQPGSKRFTLP
jgi:DsbC/DsbD-like thiol-disulfide interchange protein